MGQSLSRRPAPTSTPTSASAPDPQHTNDAHPPRRSLSRRFFSSLPKPSLRSRPLLSSLALPTRPEQTLRGKKRRWGLSRRHNVPADIEAAIPEHMDPLAEHDEHHQADRDVDEFGVITPRVPDSHSNSRATSAKGKEKAKDTGDIELNNEDDTPGSSSSAASLPTQSGARTHHIDSEQVVTTPTVLPFHQPPPLSTLQESEHSFVPPPPIPTPPSLSQTSVQPTNSNPRPFPPPGTLVVVQGVVHTTDVPRTSERPLATSNPTPSITNDVLNSNANTSFETSSARPSSLPPSTRSSNPLLGMSPRPSSIVPNVSFPPPSESMIDTTVDSQTRQATSNAGSAAEHVEDEDRAHAHAHDMSMAQGSAGGSGLSASSIDVLGTLLSVAAAATAASLLTGSSEPIFSSGLTTSQPPPSSGSISQPVGFNSNVPSERPLSPTPTSDAGRMRHVWSSLRDRLGLGSSSNHSNDTTSSSGLGLGQSVPSQPSDVTRPRDPREIMLAEMARAFNLGLGLGLGGTTASIPSGVTSHTPEGAMPDASNTLAGDADREQQLLPPPDSFERFLMDLQTDLRVTLTQEQNPGILGMVPQENDESPDEVEDQRIPELQSLSDSDSEEYETRHPESGGEDEEEEDEGVLDEGGDEEDAHTAQEQFTGRTSPAVSALGTGTRSPFGTGSRISASSHAISTCIHPAAASQNVDAEIDANDPATDSDKGDDVHAVHASSSVAVGTGSHVPVDCSSPLTMQSEEGPERQQEGAVSGVAHSPGGRRVEADVGGAISGGIAMLPHDTQNPSNVPGIGAGQDSCLPGTSCLSVPLTSNAPNSLSGGSSLTTQHSTHPPAWTVPLSSSSDPEPTAQSSSSTNPTSGDSSMPFRLPFTPSSASRTEHTPGGGINWWRMYRFPAVASPNLGQQGGPQGSLPPSQSPFRNPTEGPSHSSTSSWARPIDQNQQNEITTPRGVAEVPSAHIQLAAPTSSAATPVIMPELVSNPNLGTSTPLPTNGQASESSTGTSINPLEHRSNVVVPVIVVGLQSVNMERQSPQTPHPPTNQTPAMDDEDGEGVDFDGLEQPMSMPLHIPEPAEFRHHSTSNQQEQGGQQPTRGRTWQSRAANAIRNLRPSRRNADATSPQPQETPGSRTFLIYVIGGYYPPDHQIITGGNLDSFEALWELAELLGQVKPPTVSKEEIERSGLEIIKASLLEEYEKQGQIASNCVDRCLICLDDYDPEDELRVLTCKHAFHQACVDRWLETGRNNCPACRTKGVANQDA